ncbi:MAG: ferric reductase-like transmembrane domain-containing protein [Candidatus Staskawiczbacteria bacterium]|jgi:predicted ferric reductase
MSANNGDKAGVLKIFQNSIGLFSAVFLALIPAFLWFFTQSISAKFTDFSSWLTSIGQITGLVGMAMISINIVLSSRPVFLDRFFNGLNTLYRVHHYFGVISFLLLLVHPLILAGSYFTFSATSAGLFLLPSTDLARNFGIVAILTMMVIMSFTVFSKVKYQILKFIHGLIGITFVFGALHTFFVKSDISRNPFIHWYMLALMALAAFVYSYKTLFGRFLVMKYEYLVKEVNILSDKIVEIVMSPVKNPIKYLPGQFVFVSFHGKLISSESHPYSISSIQPVRDLRILVKALGDYTSKINNLSPGTRVKVEGPFGKLCYSTIDNRNQIWIAGGIGIAPFLGMARNLKVEGDGYKIDLYYCTDDQKEIVFLNEFHALMADRPGFKFISFCQNKDGLIDVAKIMSISHSINDKDIFICGPPSMINSLRKQLLRIRVPKSQIHSEEFKLL